MKFKLIGALLVSTMATWGIALDLAPTGFTPFTAVSNSSLDRGIYFNATTGFSIGQAGIWFDPLAGGATTLNVSVYSATGLIQGSLLATASAGVTDTGMALYNVPLNFTFTAGQQYYLAFNPTGGWGTSNDLSFFNFNFWSGNPSYTVGGAVEVLDGALGGGSNNFVMPHIVLDTDGGGGGSGGGGGGAVPEPSTYVLLGSALAAPVLRRRFLGSK